MALLTSKTADTSPSSDDITYTVNDPGGTPADRKVTLGNLVTKGHGLSDGVVKVSSGTMATATAGTDYTTPSSTESFTNKTFNANGTGNSLSNVEVADFASGVVDTDISSVSASDDTLPSAKATKTYVDSKVSDTAYASGWNGDTTTAPSKNAVYDKIETISSPFSLKTSATVTGSAAAEVSVSGLDLDTDKVYMIMAFIKAASGGSPVIGIKFNGVTSATNYQIQRIEGDGATASAARTGGASRSLGLDIPASQAQPIQLFFSKASGGATRGQYMPIGFTSTTSPKIRMAAVNYNDTTNLTSFALTDESGSSWFDVGTQLRVFTMGF